MSSNSIENITEKNMDVNAALQGQGANVNENDHTNFNTTEQKLEEKNCEINNHNLSTTIDKNMTENINEDSGKNSTECNVEILSKQHNTISTVDEATKKEDMSQNNNKELKDSTGNITDASKGLEATGADRSPEKLVDDITKLNISAEERKSKEVTSNVVVNMQSESLKSLMAYDGSSDSDSEHSDTEPQAEVCDLSSEDEENNTNTKKTWRKNTDNASGSSDSESDSTASTLSSDSESDIENSDGDSASVIDASDDGVRVDSPVLNKSSDKGAVKKKNPNILGLEEYLPPIPDLSQLNINMGSEEFMHIGRISAIISELVTITAIPGTPAFDLDSMLFIDDETGKKPIGPIFDVLGPVAEPIYCVRFNTDKDVKDLGLESGMKVYAAPKNDEFTKFVFVQELMKMRGSDASWMNDHETPSDCAEFSDDEKEREARRAKKTVKRKLDDGSLERHKRYERTMNQCNTLNTRVCKLMDAHKNLSKQIRPNRREDIKSSSGCPELTAPLVFDPTVPPPGFGQPGLYSIPTTPPQFSTSPGFGQTATFTNSLSPNNSQSNMQEDPLYSPFSTPVLFGYNYANEPPSPQNVCPPPGHWSLQHFRRARRSNNPRPNQQNSDNYFTNNGRNFRGAGPSSQPF